MKFVEKRQETGQDQEPQGAAAVLGGRYFPVYLAGLTKQKLLN